MAKQAMKLHLQQQDISKLRKVHDCFNHTLDIMDFSAVADALCCWKYFHRNFKTLLAEKCTVYQLNLLVLNVILHIDKAEVDNIFSSIQIQNQNLGVSLKELYREYHAASPVLLSVNETSPMSPQKTNTRETADDPGQVNSVQTCSSINMQFLQLTKCLQKMITDPKQFLDSCATVMVSKTCHIHLFDDDDDEKFKKCISKCNSTIFLQSLSLLWAWTDHSILTELLTNTGCNAAAVLLEKFTCHSKELDHVRITEFPIPSPSSKMIPTNVNKNMHTVLAIKYRRMPDECTLKDICDVRQEVIRNCDVLDNAMQFLTVASNHSKFTIIYWFISKHVIPLLNTKILENNSSLQEKGIIELAIYPGLHFTTDKYSSPSFGPLALLITPPDTGFKPARKGNGNLMAYLSRTEELPNILQLFQNQLDEAEKGIHTKSMDLDAANKMIKKFTDIDFEDEKDNDDSIGERDVSTQAHSQLAKWKKVRAYKDKLEEDLIKEKDKLHQALDEISKLKENNRSLEESVADYQLQIKLQDEELAQVHSKLTMKEREHDKIKYEFKQLEGRHQAVKTDFQKEKEVNNALQQQIERKSSDNQSLVQQCDQLAEELLAKKEAVIHASKSARLATKTAKVSLKSADEAHKALIICSSQPADADEQEGWPY
ncbi:uncharacterized protein [Dysidea avara]|uniref:uncharacterized protein isoform X2 n=1 Tax=Dysidea avara TaxID=196820 RepID=UPI00332AFCF7